MLCSVGTSVASFMAVNTLIASERRCFENCTNFTFLRVSCGSILINDLAEYASHSVLRPAGDFSTISN
jgi:hypothetical protein